MLPGKRLNRLDALDLDLLQESLALKFLDTLLTKSKFNFPIAYSRSKEGVAQLPVDQQKGLLTLNKRLNAITYENRDNFLEHGTEPFGFGYPLLIKRDRQDPSKIIKAPILIWSLDIDKSDKQAYRWTIKRGEDYPIYLNQVLISHIENDEGISIQSIIDEYLADDLLEEQEVVNLCNQILTQLNANEEYPKATIAVCPGPETIKHIEVNKPSIRWSGVFGIYKTQKESIIKDVEQLINNPQNYVVNAPPTDAWNELMDAELRLETEFYEADHELNTFQKSSFAGVATDPSQQAILNNIATVPQQIIQGPPGTGKSQSLTAIITNALENNAKCLIVCQKRTALEVIQQNLNKLGLHELNVIIEDIAKDRAKVVDSVRDRIDRKFTPVVFGEKRYQYLLTEAEKNKTAINEGHRFLGMDLLGSFNWTDLVGLYLQSEAKQSKAILADHLNSTDFDFTFEEFVQIKHAIAEGKPLFERIGQLDHPLDLINHQLYQQFNVGALVVQIEKTNQNLLSDLASQEQQLLGLQGLYEQRLTQHLQDAFLAFQTPLKSLQQTITDNVTAHQNNFNMRLGGRKLWVKTAAFLSSKFQQIRTTQQQVLSSYETLKKLHAAQPYFTFEWLTITEEQPPTFSNLNNHLLELEAVLLSWQALHPEIIRKSVSELSHKTLFPDLAFDDELFQSTQQYRQFIQQVNESELLIHQVPENTVSVNDELTSLELLAETLQSIQTNIKDFKPFYNWKNFYLQLNSAQQKVLVALIQTKPKAWTTALESWYYYWLLARNESTHTPSSEEPIHALAQLLATIREKQTAKIINSWTSTQQKSVKHFNTKGDNYNVKRLYNKRGSKGKKRNSLRKIIKADFDLFTDFFPVLLVNPVVCSSIVPLIQNLFDVVIFDEASQLRLEDTFVALLRGKCKIVSGDIHQMPPSSYFGTQNVLLLDAPEEDDEELPADDLDLLEKESLLEYAEDMGYQRSFLDFHYRSRHPYLIDFSNSAFYGSRLVPMPAQVAYRPMLLVECEGIYDKSLNEIEADEVINLLLEKVQPLEKLKTQAVDEPLEEESRIDSISDSLPEGNARVVKYEIEGLPSVGIATFNLHQRNLIIEKIQTIKHQGDAAAEKMMALERAGLFVKNLENIQGDERDIIIISTTFGKRVDGRFLQLFGPINLSKGYKLLNVIITRAKHQVMVCTSIPSEFYNRYTSEIMEKGITGRSCLYAYIAYAKAVSNGQEEVRQSILQLLAQHCNEKAQQIANVYAKETSPFIQVVAQQLQKHFEPEQIKIHYKVGGFVVDIAILRTDAEMEANANLKPIAIECDGNKNHPSPEAYMHDIYREEQLQRLGFQFERIFAANWWLNEEKELESLVGGIVRG